jgi:hypothetical protein
VFYNGLTTKRSRLSLKRRRPAGGTAILATRRRIRSSKSFVIPDGPTSQTGEVSARGGRFQEFEQPCALIGLSSDAETDEAQVVASRVQRLESVRRERATKMRAERVGGPVTFKKHRMVGHP